MTPQDKIPYMANQIAAFFARLPEREAAKSVADHINAFWEPRMRRQLSDLLAQGAPGLHPAVRAAAPKLRLPGGVVQRDFA